LSAIPVSTTLATTTPLFSSSMITNAAVHRAGLARCWDRRTLTILLASPSLVTVPLHPVGVVGREALEGFGVILLELFQPPLAPLISPVHQFVVALRVALLEVLESFLDVRSALGHQLMKPFGVVLPQVLQMLTAPLKELTLHPLVGFGVGLLQMRKPIT